MSSDSSSGTRPFPPPRLRYPRSRARSTSTRRITRAEMPKKCARFCQLISLASTSGLYRSFLELCDASTGIDIGPPNRLRAFIVFGDEAPQLAREIGHGRENPAGQEIALHLGEPEFHLVEPRGVGGRVMQLHVGMRLEEGHHLRGLMRRQVVRNDVDLPVAPLRRDDLLQEGDELLAGV